jgi:hypothetical protein
MLVAFRLVTQMHVLVGTVRVGIFVEVPGCVSYVLMLVRVDRVPVDVFVGVAMHVLMAMFMVVFV